VFVVRKNHEQISEDRIGVAQDRRQREVLQERMGIQHGPMATIPERKGMDTRLGA
jgi:hypothetical protein